MTGSGKTRKKPKKGKKWHIGDPGTRGCDLKFRVVKIIRTGINECNEQEKKNMHTGMELLGGKRHQSVRKVEKAKIKKRSGRAVEGTCKRRRGRKSGAEKQAPKRAERRKAKNNQRGMWKGRERTKEAGGW